MSEVPTCAFTTLGCRVNQYDAETLKQSFRNLGYRVVPFAGPADVYVINTCAVTAEAEAKSRRAVRRARTRSPAAVVAVVGCYPQVAPDRAGADGADLVLGTGEGGRLAGLADAMRRGRGGPRIEAAPPEPAPSPGRTRATLKIQDGCDLHCSYCLVPRARGPARSRDLAQVRAEAAGLAQAGYREIVLVGICLGAYGTGQGLELADAVEACLEAGARHRVRLSSVEVTQVTPRLLSLLAGEGRLCRHLALPLQSGSRRILSAMGRGYTPAEYLAVVDECRRRVPGLALTTDVMTGFPGEEEEDFLKTCRLAEAAQFSRMHVFRYSARPGTAAAALSGQVPGQLRAERARRLLALGERLSVAFRQGFVGETLEVLVETRRHGLLEGLTDNYIRLAFPGPAGGRGRFAAVRVTGVDGEVTRGEAVGRPRDSCEGWRIGSKGG